MDFLEDSKTNRDVENTASDVDDTEHTDANTKQKNDCETANLFRTNHEQNRADQSRCDVRVQNGRECFCETVAHSDGNTVSLFRFFTHSFVNQNVCVDHHPDGEDETGQTWEGEGGIEADHECKCKQNEQKQRENRNHTGEAIVVQHNSHHEQNRNQHGVLCALNRVFTELRFRRHFTDWLTAERCGQTTGLQYGHQKIDFFTCVDSRNLTAVGDFRLNVRRTDDASVQNDSQLTVVHEVGRAFVTRWTVVAREFSHAARTFGVE